MTSAAGALGAPGFGNALGLPEAPRVCVVMVDGLGRSLLRQRSGHAPFLRAALDAGQPFPSTLASAFPSTTAASLASLGTGVAPGQHGMVGYDVLDPAQDKVVNLLGNWDQRVEPELWQPFPTVFERLQDELPVATVSLPKFEGSPLTVAALRGGGFTPATSPHARTTAAAELMARHERMLMYFYWGELDKAGHRFGAASPRWEHELEELDSAVKRLSAQLPAGTLLLVTGDHGMVDVPESARIDFSADPALVAGVRHTAGEPRMLHLYFEPDAGPAARQALVQAWQDRHGSRAWVLTRDEAVGAGLFGPVRPEVLPRIGDVLVAAREPVAFFDTRRVRPAALGVVGQHGSLTKAEREVPLLRIPVAGTTGKKGRRG
ncbi:alkaline phosphatase family protein [Paenarthrobacter sp. DKR-5]|uniref:alkaline phosphatase family protein n=1 Tax=Paenarthrobacter sp. DKR-5 TaxID=2835535 RepID=UPI001BDC6DCE|nr:nucleotide pyrophosphatase/phosphodiesterase family protein [Paenarthrobacter sp. DKR-5]MBT1002095.1 alkaline phosphatase family protein [Paenarthrobacter sp. DKR-5]